MYKVFIAYIIVFFLECCNILSAITIGSVELKFSIIFELYMFLGLLSRFNKFRSILNKVKEIKFLFLMLLLSLIFIINKSYSFESLILTLRIILILSVSFIPFVYNFGQKKITNSFKIIEYCIIIYSFITLFLFIENNHFGTRFFGPMGDTFAWILGVYAVKYFIEKKYFIFALCIIYLIVITGTISALFLSLSAIFLYGLKKRNSKENFLFILLFCLSFFLISSFIPNLIENSSLSNRFNIVGSSTLSSFENNSNFKRYSCLPDQPLGQLKWSA